MALELRGDYSSGNMVSVPPPSDESGGDSSGGKKGSSDDVNVTEEIPEEEEENTEADAGEPKKSFGSRLKDAFSGILGAGGVTAAFSTAATAVASALHIPPAAASIGMGLVLATTVGTGVIAVDQYMNTLNPALFVADDCNERVAEAKTDDTTDGEKTDEETNAKIIYSALKSIYGLDDAHIAAVLSNFSAESGIDPTGVETIFDEPYEYGPKKKAAIENIDSFTRTVVFNAYAGVCTLNTDFYCQPDGVARCGIGLAGETGPNCKDLLEKAEGLGQDWWNMEFQFAWELATYEDKWKTFKEQSGDCESLALWFVHNYEGNYTFDAEHMARAKEWEQKMASWSVDQSVASNINSLMQQMGAMGATGSKKEVGKRQKDCTPCRSNKADYDNSSMAAAAVSYAYPDPSMGYGDNGTELYQKVHEAIFPGDPYFMSCDRGTTCAIRWSGKDDDVPAGPTSTTESHFASSDRWQDVTDTIKSEEDLQPGDVWNTVGDGHIFMYTGHEIIEQIHGSAAPSTANYVEASLNDYSPHCDTLSFSPSSGGVIYRNGDGRAYKVWRCVNEEVSDKYTGVADGLTVSVSGKKSGSKDCGDSSKNTAQVKKIDSAGNVNWDLSESEFVNSWSYAIDVYLNGSPLADKGRQFAQAAWDNKVDPRISPAIACIESSKGADCFRPYNAWGWMADLGSNSGWDETIRKHIEGLKKGNYSPLTPEGGARYCTSNPNWYNEVVQEMNRIASNYKRVDVRAE